MQTTSDNDEVENGGLRARRVALQDGRYLIYYTFADANLNPKGEAGSEQNAGNTPPPAEPAATDSQPLVKDD